MLKTSKINRHKLRILQPVPKIKKIKISHFHFSVYLCITSSESSSVGRAQPCQGWGREFESRLSLSCLGGGTGRHAGLKILFPLRECGFDSRPRYKRLILRLAFFYIFSHTTQQAPTFKSKSHTRIKQ